MPYADVSFEDVIPALLPRLSALPKKELSPAVDPNVNASTRSSTEMGDTGVANGITTDDQSALITHAQLWSRVDPFLKEWDIVVGDAGTGRTSSLYPNFPSQRPPPPP